MAEKNGPRDIIAYKTDARIVIDGALDEPAWREAAVVGDFYTIIDGERRPAASSTAARLLWDDSYLYIGAEMSDKDICAIKTQKNSKTWEDDVFEAFIKPSESNPGYYEMHFTPLNTTLQLFFPRRHMRGSIESYVFESGVNSAVKIKGELNNWRVMDEGWTVEAAIPFSGLSHPAPAHGTVWRGAFCRYDYSYYLPAEYERGRELSTSAPLSRLDFHLYEDYDRIVFLVK